MEKHDFTEALKLEIGKETWKGNIGLKKVPNGLVMMFYDASRDCISAATFIPVELENPIT